MQKEIPRRPAGNRRGIRPFLGASGRQARERAGPKSAQHKKLGSAEPSLHVPADFGASRRTYNRDGWFWIGRHSQPSIAKNRKATNRRLCDPARLKCSPAPGSNLTEANVFLAGDGCERCLPKCDSNLRMEWTLRNGREGKTPRADFAGHAPRPPTRAAQRAGTAGLRYWAVFVRLRSDGVFARPHCACCYSYTDVVSVGWWVGLVAGRPSRSFDVDCVLVAIVPTDIQPLPFGRQAERRLLPMSHLRLCLRMYFTLGRILLLDDSSVLFLCACGDFAFAAL